MERAVVSAETGVEVVVHGATDDEAAAILAAYEVLWPKPAAAVSAAAAPSPWRFSGRWWGRGLRTSR